MKIRRILRLIGWCYRKGEVLPKKTVELDRCLVILTASIFDGAEGCLRRSGRGRVGPRHASLSDRIADERHGYMPLNGSS